MRHFIVSFLFLIIFFISLFASSETVYRVVDRPELLNIKLNTTSVELNEGDSTQLSATATYDNNISK
ncbi:MAG: hypothetical protein COB99_08060, partial [Sulfurimonas sp.]